MQPMTPGSAVVLLSRGIGLTTAENSPSSGGIGTSSPASTPPAAQIAVIPRRGQNGCGAREEERGKDVRSVAVDLEEDSPQVWLGAARLAADIVAVDVAKRDLDGCGIHGAS